MIAEDEERKLSSVEIAAADEVFARVLGQAVARVLGQAAAARTRSRANSAMELAALCKLQLKARLGDARLVDVAMRRPTYRVPMRAIKDSERRAKLLAKEKGLYVRGFTARRHAQDIATAVAQVDAGLGDVAGNQLRSEHNAERRRLDQLARDAERRRLNQLAAHGDVYDMSGIPQGWTAWSGALRDARVAAVVARGKDYLHVPNIVALLEALTKTEVFAVNFDFTDLPEFKSVQELLDALRAHVASGGPIRRYYINDTKATSGVRKSSGLFDALRDARAADRENPERVGAAWLRAPADAWVAVTKSKAAMGAYANKERALRYWTEFGP